MESVESTGIWNELEAVVGSRGRYLDMSTFHSWEDPYAHCISGWMEILLGVENDLARGASLMCPLVQSRCRWLGMTCDSWILLITCDREAALKVIKALAKFERERSQTDEIHLLPVIRWAEGRLKWKDV